ncbi:hypothetical protein GJAV_G00057300 [Gymnothorax javanicus]|nr:hypothetical protein GJAV_G00057300 [Gymnothorax javanicus]
MSSPWVEIQLIDGPLLRNKIEGFIQRRHRLESYYHGPSVRVNWCGDKRRVGTILKSSNKSEEESFSAE